MTEANRRAIYEAARDRERGERRRETRSSVPIGGAGERLTGLIAGLRKEKKLVGLAAMVTVDGKVMASAADGERKKGSGVPIELGDRWHLGSVTKSITATMIARLVESGRMQWTDTIGGRFPDASIHEDWKPVTLRQLLTHTSAARANFSFQVMRKQPVLGPECTRERRKAVIDVLAAKPAHPRAAVRVRGRAGAERRRKSGVPTGARIARPEKNGPGLTRFRPPRRMEE